MKDYQCVPRIEFAVDMMAEGKMLEREATSKGYSSVDQFIAGSPIEFQKIAIDWRNNHAQTRH